LDQLDALIDGLHSVGDVRRLRDAVPAYWSARQDIPDIEKRVSQLLEEQTSLGDEERVIEERLRSRLVVLLPQLSAGHLDVSALQNSLRDGEDEATLLLLARARRDLAAIAEQWRSIAAGPAAENRRSIEQEDTEARGALERWTADVGASLNAIVAELQKSIPDLGAPLAANPEAVRTSAALVVEIEVRRIDNILMRTAADEKRISELQLSIEQGKARTDVLDQQISDAAGVNEGLAQALSMIVPHINSEDCPVCGRDFSEISTIPLSAHLSARIASLVETAGRLQALSSDKATTGAAIAVAERELSGLTARLLPSSERDDLKRKRARFDELRQRLAGLQEGTERGTALVQRAAATSRRLTDLRSQDQIATSLRQSVDASASKLSQPILGAGESIETGSSRLQRYLENRERELGERLTLRRSALEEVEELRSRRMRLTHVRQQIEAEHRKLQRLSQAKAEADRRIDLAKELAKHTRETRANFVRKVFNDELNAVWQNLFVRLAPDEPFLPAFTLRQSSA